MTVQDRYKTYLSDQRRHFDELVTEDWETYLVKEATELWRFEVDLLMRWVRPATILDLGCGCGFHDAEMARRPFVRHIDAIDYSVKSIEKAVSHYADRKINYCAADFSEFQTRTLYDLVVSFQVIEHLESPETFLQTCAERCSAGGHVALFTVNRLRPYNRNLMRRGKSAELEDSMHKQEFSRAELRELGRRCGLAPRRIFTYAVEKLWRSHRLGLWMGYLLPMWGTRLGAVYSKSG